MMHVIKVEITSTTQTGKTAIATVLANVLRENGVKVRVKDSPEEDELTPQNLKDRLSRIQNGAEVEITVNQVPRRYYRKYEIGGS